MKPLRIVTDALICSALLVVAPRVVSALSDEQKRDIRTQIDRKFFHEEIAHDLAKKYGAGAVPFLLDMLEKERSPRVKGRICFYLGYFRDLRTVQPMFDLINRQLPKGMTRDELSSLRLTILGLGFTGFDDALDYLAKLASNEYWEARPVHPRVPGYGYDEATTRRELRQHATVALECAGNKKAIAILEKLKKGAAEDLTHMLDGALRQAKRRIKEGPPWTWPDSAVP